MYCPEIKAKPPRALQNEIKKNYSASHPCRFNPTEIYIDRRPDGAQSLYGCPKPVWMLRHFSAAGN
jgi:hypothetical protein